MRYITGNFSISERKEKQFSSLLPLAYCLVSQEAIAKYSYSLVSFLWQSTCYSNIIQGLS